MDPPIRNPGELASFEWFATRQAGLVARRQLLAAGVDGETVRRRFRGGLLLGSGRGVYRLAHRAPTEWQREMAATLACGPGALISHRSAARVHGFLRYPKGGVVWVTSTRERGAATRGLRVVRTRVLEPEDVSFHGWLPLTSPARTILDLAGLEDAETLEAAVAEAQVLRLVGEDDLRAELARGNGRRGARALRALIERLAPPAATKSRAEVMMLRLIRSSGLPEPKVNERLGRWYPDFWWPEHGLVAEYDSIGFHQDIGAFRRDREKSNELQLMGLVVLRFTWQELTKQPKRLVARLRTALYC